MNELADRVQREFQHYEQGLERRKYNDVLSHTHYFFRRRRRHLIRERLIGRLNEPILEIGCVSWRTVFENNNLFPEKLTCINLSKKELAIGRELAKNTRIQPTFLEMDAHNLHFPSQTFGVVYGISVLHHLDLDVALREIRRVLRPNGLFIFAEPLASNPVAKFIRFLTPRARTPDETPFSDREIKMITDRFSCKMHYEQLFSVPAGLLSRFVFKSPENPLTRGAFRADLLIAEHAPALHRFFRNVLIDGYTDSD